MSNANQAAAWVLPQVDGPIVGSQRRNPTELQAAQRAVWDQAFAEGRKAGLEAARLQQQALVSEQQQRVRQLDQLLGHLARPLQDLDAEVVRQLVQLAAGIARQVVRREVKIQPDQIIALIREMLALLPASARDVRVHLHPDDARFVRERLAETNAERAWSIAEDPVLTRGGCRIQSLNSTIDAQIESRLAAAIAAALGDERQRAEREDAS